MVVGYHHFRKPPYLDPLNSSSFTFKAVKRFGLLFLCWGYIPRMPDGTGIFYPHLAWIYGKSRKKEKNIHWLRIWRSRMWPLKSICFTYPLSYTIRRTKLSSKANRCVLWQQLFSPQKSPQTNSTWNLKPNRGLFSGKSFLLIVLKLNIANETWPNTYSYDVTSAFLHPLT